MKKALSKATTSSGAAGNGHSACPIHDLISRLGDKWSVLVLMALAKADHNRLRFSELMRAVSGISQRMLATTLRYLERDGIVTRHLYAEVPPRVEYTLTERGHGLLVTVRALFMWIDAQWPQIEKSRQAYDAKLSADKAERGPGADTERGPGVDTERGPGVDTERGPGVDTERGQ